MPTAPGFLARQLASPLAWVALLSLLLSGIFFDAFIYDVLTYHGPFAAVATGLPRLSLYGMSEFMEHRFQGFPALWRWMLAPGLGLGLPRVMGVPNLLALLALVGAGVRCLRLPWRVGLAVALIYPIALFSFRSAYQDFFVGALTSAGILLVISAIGQWRETGQGAGSAWLAVPLLVASSLTKYQGLFQAVLGLALATGVVLALGWRRGREAETWWRGPLPALVVALLLCGLHPLHNLLILHNPFFPIAVGPFSGPEIKGSDEIPAYTAALAPFHTFLNHWLSATEFDWVARGVVPAYNIDQGRAQTQYGGLIDPRAVTGLVRSGGSFGPTYLAAMGAYAVAFSQALGEWRRKRGPSQEGWAVLAVAPFLLLAAGFPQSHELRYYLALLILPALTALGWGWQHWRRRWIEAALVLALSVSMLLNFIQPLHSTLKGIAAGRGLSYAIDYPVRDLPTAQACLRQARHRQGPGDTLELPTGMAFACRMQLPARFRIIEGEASPSLTGP